MLDCAANAITNWPVDQIREQFVLSCNARNLDPVVELREFLGPDEDSERYWAIAKSNLEVGRIRLLFVSDQILPTLRRIVEFLNQQMNPAEVLAIEIRQFASNSDPSLRTLVPRVIGQSERDRTSKSPVKGSNRPVPISRDEFLEDVQSELRTTAQAIFHTAETAGFSITELLNTGANVIARLGLPGVTGAPFNLYRDWLWVSLGNYYPVLRVPTTNREIRQAVLKVWPSCAPANNPSKGEVGIRLDAINQEGLARLPDLFNVMKNALLASEGSKV
jgi:hypothetical protein